MTQPEPHPEPRLNAIPMTDERLKEISRAACARQAIQNQVASHRDERVSQCLEHIGELLEEVIRLKAELAEVRAEIKTLEDAHPFRNYKPSNHEATGNDIVDRLRGIYRTPINDGAGPLNGKDHYERRFAVGELSHHAADHIENLKRGLIEANKDTERLEWIDANQEMFDEAWRFSDSGNMIRDIIDTERERGKQ